MTRLLLICALGASAGIHAALVPGHLAENRTLGLAFAAAVVLLAATAVGLALRPSPGLALAAGVVFAGLILAYVGSRVSEPVDAVGIGTKAIESLGLLLAIAAARAETRGRTSVRLRRWCSQSPSPRWPPPSPRPTRTSTRPARPRTGTDRALFRHTIAIAAAAGAPTASVHSFG